MAITQTLNKDALDVWGKQRVAVAELVLDNSYPAGGYTLSPEAFGLKTIRGVLCVGGNAAAARLIYWWDTANQKFMVHYPTGGATASPAALADPVPSTPILAHAPGATPVTSTAATMPDHAATAGTQAPGQGKEVLATTDLTTITVSVWVFGI